MLVSDHQCIQSAKFSKVPRAFAKGGQHSHQCGARRVFPSLLFSFIPPVLRSLLKDRKTQQTHEENGHGICI